MTYVFPLASPPAAVDQLSRQLTFEQTVSPTVTKTVRAYCISDDGKHIVLPKYHCIDAAMSQRSSPTFRIQNRCNPVREPLSADITFDGTLYPVQRDARNECIELLNRYKSCILSLPVGCGKCLHPDTQLVLYGGGTTTASQVIEGDLLMGDDGTPRKVLSTTCGLSVMYTVANAAHGVEYTVNKDHVMTVVDTSDGQIVDIPLSVLLSMSTDTAKSRYRGVRVPVDVWGTLTRDDRMRHINSVFPSPLENTATVSDAETADWVVQLARSLGLDVTATPARDEDGSIDLVMRGAVDGTYPLETIESKGRGIYCGFELDGNGRFLLGDFTVTHNTATSINLAAKVKLKTLIIVNRLVLSDQWAYALHQFSPLSSVYMLQPKDCECIPETHDFYIVNAINVRKFTREQLAFIGLVIVDECHLIMSEILSQCMWKLEPRYLVGLSASPYRLDGLDGLMNAYFGPNKVVRSVERSHTVYRVDTGFAPESRMTRFGKLDWNALINDVSCNPDRNRLIIDIVRMYPDRCFLLLTKRVGQASALAALLDEAGIEYDKLYGTHSYVRSDKRVLIGTTGKCGVGFDAPKLDTLVVCCDMVNYYGQMLGRVMRSKSQTAWVFDLVDTHPTLLRHYYERSKVYRETGGTIHKLAAADFTRPAMS